MLAYVLPSAGAQPELSDAPIPTPGPGEVLVRVLASSANPVDDMVASGFFREVQEYRYPAIIGRDLCGVIEEVGADVTKFAPGDTVWGFIKRDHVGNGTFAEYVTCDASRSIAHKPSQLSDIDAGSMGLSAVTALECLDALGLASGNTVLINGATGGVGSFAVQIAAARGLRVLATGRSAPAKKYLEELGAHEVIDWTAGSLADAVLTLSPEGVDGVVDLVRRDRSVIIGMDETPAKTAVAELMTAVLKPGGRFSTVNNSASDDLISRGVGFNIHSEPTPENLETLNALAERGQLRGCVTSVYPLARIDEAFAHQRQHGRGKTAVVIDDALWAATAESIDAA
jgi:NADPH:quinone reductase-like Zn-dependent oxidoreductase